MNREVAASNEERGTLSKAITADHDEHAQVSQQTPSHVSSIHKDLADYNAALRRQVAGWKAERASIRTSRTVRRTDVRREVIAPTHARLAMPNARRSRSARGSRPSPPNIRRSSASCAIQAAMEAKIREVHALDRARRDDGVYAMSGRSACRS